MAEEPQVYEFQDGRFLREFWGRSVSKVWKFFKFEVTSSGDYVDKSVVYCRVCSTKMKYCGNTTNMANHLLRKHPALHHEGWNTVARESLDEDVHVKEEPWLEMGEAETRECAERCDHPNMLDEIKVEKFEMTENGDMTILKSFWGDCSDRVWDYFKFEVDGEGKYCNKEVSVCTICQCRLYYAGNIVTLQSHLNTSHQELQCTATMNDERQVTLISSTSEEEYVKRVLSMCAKEAQEDCARPVSVPAKVSATSPAHHRLYKPFWGNATSIVWEHFKFEADENGSYVSKEIVYCQHCDAKLKYCHNTTNMGYHLERWHQIPRSSSTDSPYSAAKKRSVHTVCVASTKSNEKFSTLDVPDDNSEENHSPIQDDMMPLGGQQVNYVPRRRFAKDGSESKYIWKHFRISLHDHGLSANRNGVFCMLCGARFNNNLRRMKQHLQQCHNTPLQSAFDQPDAIRPTGAVPKEDVCKDIWQSIAEHFITDLRPVSDIDSPSFRKICLTINPKLVIPNRQTFTEDILMPIYVEHKENLMSEIAKASQHSLTMDWWKSNTNQQFVTFTIHFISESWHLVSKVIRTWHIGEHPTAHDMACKLSSLQADWRLKDLVVVTDDNYAMTEAVNNILNWPSVSAVDHSVNLAVKKVFSMEFVRNILTNVRSIFARLHELADKGQIKQNQIQLQLPQRDLLQDFDESQWTNTLKMLVLFVEQWPLLQSLMDCKLDDDLIISTEALGHLQNDLTTTLEVFKVATAYMSPTRQHPVSVIMPMLIKLKNCLKISESDSKLNREVKQNMSLVMEKRYQDEDVKMLLKKASALDPRMKKLYFLPHFEQCKVRKILYKEATTLANETIALTKETADELGDNSSDEDGESQAKLPRLAEPSMSDWLGDIVSVKKKLTIGEKIETEMKRFLSEPDLRFEMSPIGWWQARCNMYPLLSPLARRYMCIPAIGMEMDKDIQAKRKCLQSDTAHMLLFLQQFSETEPVW